MDNKAFVMDEEEYGVEPIRRPTIRPLSVDLLESSSKTSHQSLTLSSSLIENLNESPVPSYGSFSSSSLSTAECCNTSVSGSYSLASARDCHNQQLTNSCLMFSQPPASSSSSRRPSTPNSTCSAELLKAEKYPINIHRNVMYTENLYQTKRSKDHNNNNPGNNQTSVSQFRMRGSDASINSPNGHPSIGELEKNQQDNSERKGLFSNLFCCSRNSSQPNRSSSPFSIITFLQRIFPILHWLPNYSFRQNLSCDLVAGVTVFALNIPQGLSYGRLAGVEPINGLYVSLFPVVIYALMGTSRQISIGTFAVISIACRDALASVGIDPSGSKLEHNMTNKSIQMLTSSNGTTATDQLPTEMTPIQILTVLCLLVGIIQFILGTFRLGVLAILLSDTLISAFVVGSAIHVFTSQVFSLLGLKSAITDDFIRSIPFELVRVYANLALKLPHANLTTISVSLFTIGSLVMFKYLIEPYLQKRFKLQNIALPIDIFMIIFVTILSGQLNLKDKFHVEVIPEIPAGFKNLPTVPPIEWNLVSKLLGNAFLISFIAYVSTFSLGKMYAKKNGNYKVSANQELLAMGTANIVSSFFLCFPCSGSLARSAVQDRVGGKTQLATLFSSFLVVLFLLYFSAYLNALPQCVLASTIVVALISTLKKFSEFFEIWKISKLDGVVWIATFAFVTLFGVGNGLLYGLATSLVFLLIRLSFPSFHLKGPVPNSEVYLESSQVTTSSLVSSSNGGMGFPDHLHSNRQMSTGVLIFDFQGPLIFINTSLFKYNFAHYIGAKLTPVVNNDMSKQNLTIESNSANKHFDVHSSAVDRISSVIFDCSHLSYIDRKGVEMLTELNHDLQTQHNVQLLLASPSSTVYTMLDQCNYFDHFDRSKCLATVHDAYVLATSTIASNSS